MRTAKEIYETEQLGKYEEIADYQPMLEEFGKILIQVDEDDYQGSSYLLYDNGGHYGYLCFGWGSCSGCDELQRCESMEEVQELMDKLYNDITWFENIQDLKQFFDKEWELCHEGHEEAFPSFLHQVRLFISRKERLQLLQDFERLARNEVITKACWWLRENAHFFVSDTTGDIDEEKLVEEFRKAMEE